jgi:AbrB family looped-hinge helix DNA binding protein
MAAAAATLTSKGQITLPKQVRDELGLQPGDKVEFEKRDGRYVLRRRNRSALEFAGILQRPGDRTLTVEEMDQAVGAALAEDNERIRARR